LTEFSELTATTSSENLLSLAFDRRRKKMKKIHLNLISKATLILEAPRIRIQQIRAANQKTLSVVHLSPSTP